MLRSGELTLGGRFLQYQPEFQAVLVSFQPALIVEWKPALLDLSSDEAVPPRFIMVQQDFQSFPL